MAKLSNAMEKALNDQINAELYSSYLYFSMATFLEDNKLKGVANWMANQAIEETVHAKKFYTYIIERGNRVKLDAIKGPPTDWASAKEIFEQALKHEEYITSRINDLATLADQENDRATQNLLQWFINEQVEEEASVQEILDQFELLASHPGGMYILDRDLMGRGAPAQAGE